MSPLPDPAPITVVSGLPRSGTSLMMAILRAGGVPILEDGVRAPDPDNPGGYHELDAVRRTREDPSWLDRAPGHAVKVIYRLLYDLPEDRTYRVLFMERRLEEIHASQEIMLRRRGESALSMPFERFRDLFAAELARVQTWLSRRPAFQVLAVDYNRLVASPEPILERIAGFLGRTLDLAAMPSAIDPALYRQRRE